MNSMQTLFCSFRLTDKYIGVSLMLIALSGVALGQAIAGTLTNSSTSVTAPSGNCTYTTVTTNWTFKDNLAVAHPFPGPTTTRNLEGCSRTCAEGTGQRTGCILGCLCRPSSSTSQQEWSSDKRYFLTATGTTGSVTAEAGYVDPKFLVVGVTYAPPGPSSNTFVSYTNSTMVGNTQSLSQSFMTSDTQSVTLNSGISIPLVTKGSFSNTVATTGTQSTKSSSTVTSSFQVSSGEKTFGTGDFFAPVNHDFDQIWVWLNPAALFTINAGNPLPVWNGYGADSTDQNGLDIVPVALGFLNGDFGAIPPDIQTSFNRSWAANQIWPAGQGPALTSADLAQIASFDPFSISTYGPNEIGSVPPSPSTPDNRFTLTLCNNSNSFSYLQADPSTTSNIFTCALTYTNLSTLAQEISSGYSQTFSTDTSFSGGFLADFSIELKTANTLSWMLDAQSSITTSTSSMGNLSAQGPPCNNVVPGEGPCVPVYDANGDQPTQFMVYQDNMFGTFMFAPVHFY